MMHWLRRLLNGRETPQAEERERQRLADQMAERLALRMEDRERRLEALDSMADLFPRDQAGEDRERRTD